VFSVPAATAEAVCNLLSEEVGGVEQRDPDTSPGLLTGVTELVVWIPSSEVSRRVSQVETLLRSLKELGTQIDPWSWRSEEVDPKSWQDAYKRFFSVNRLGRRFVVKPSWETYEAKPGELVIEMDPGMAFGTGLHASTQLVIHAMERVARLGPAPSSVLDVGTGTGILALAAAKLWPNTRVVAVDNDETAVQISRENVRRNGLDGRVHVDLRAAGKIDGRYYLVLANLSPETLTELQPRLRRNLDDYGRLVLSGLPAEQASGICRLFTRDMALEPEFTEELEGWQALLLRVRD
jgi:ribosomal protein L11 methyltransferase